MCLSVKDQTGRALSFVPLADRSTSLRESPTQCLGMIVVVAAPQTTTVATTDQTALRTGWALLGATEAVTGRLCSIHRCVVALAIACFPAHPYQPQSCHDRRDPYPRDQPPPRDYRGREPSFRDQPVRDAPVRDLPLRDARDTLPPAPAPVSPLIVPVPTQPASQIVVPPPEPQIDREKVHIPCCCLPDWHMVSTLQQNAC